MSKYTFHPDDAADAQGLLDSAIERIVRGASIHDFSDWFAQQAAGVGNAAPNDVDSRRPALAMARALWAAVPVPANHWRPRVLPKTERNDPCYCGSGRKFKHCCAEFSHIEFPLSDADLTGLVISHMAPEELTVNSLRRLPPHALAQAAFHWNDHGRSGRTAQILAPLFEQATDLDDRYEPAFDALLDALLATGEQVRRRALAQKVAQGRDKHLATAARCRLVSMLADQGDFAEAWRLFKEAQRAAPTDPQLWHLELTVLISEGRQDEAQLRAPLLASQARRAGFAELADMLIALGQGGMRALQERMEAEDDDGLDDVESAWIALCAQVPQALDTPACRALYRIDHQPPSKPDDQNAKTWLHVRPQRKLAALQQRWQRQFPVSKPMMAGLVGDADVLWEEVEEVRAFLHDNPLAWCSVDVVDDLLLTAAEVCEWESPPVLLDAAWRLAEHGLRLLRALWSDATSATEANALNLGAQWADTDTRPMLRILAQAIEFARLTRRDAQAIELLLWGLALNPNDNHGWRALLVEHYMATSQFADALQLLDRYPGDFPPAEHQRALALFALDRPDEARSVLTAAHNEYPAFLRTLLPEVCDPPAPEDGPGIRVGGLEAAFNYRSEARAIWVRTGALDWARGLQLPEPKAKPNPKPLPKSGKSAKASKAVASKMLVLPETVSAASMALLQSHFEFDRLEGYLTAIAWAPDLVMPGSWVYPAMQLLRREHTQAPHSIDAVNKILQPVMEFYNALNSRLLQTPLNAGAPLPFTAGAAAKMTDMADDRVFAWASGFVQGSELSAAAWRRAGRTVTAKPVAKGGMGSFTALYALAARAPILPTAGEGSVNAEATPWQPRGDAGQSLLAGVDAGGATPGETLHLALSDLWQVTAPIRQARAQGA